MPDDDLETLMTARAALTKQRLSWAQTIGAAGEIPEAAIKAINEVQQAIEVIDIAIEELEAKLVEDLEEIEEDEDEKEGLLSSRRTAPVRMAIPTATSSDPHLQTIFGVILRRPFGRLPYPCDDANSGRYPSRLLHRGNRWTEGRIRQPSPWARWQRPAKLKIPSSRGPPSN